MLDLYTGEANLRHLIDYVDKIYLHFGAPGQVWGEDEKPYMN